MTEENKFIPVDTINLYGDGIGKVTLYDTSHANESEEQRIFTVTTIASLAYGNESAKKPEELYERMKSIKHESLWEFIRYIDRLDRGGTIDYSMRNNSTLHKFNGENTFDIEDEQYRHQSNIACFRIKVPIFVARQFMRHRSFSYLEMSRRYTKGDKVPFEFWFPNSFDEISRKGFSNSYIQDYKIFVEEGNHTQVASRFLPQTTYTEFYMMGEVEGLRNFFRLRLDEHSQAEIRECAEAMLKLLNRHQPELYIKVLP